MSGCGQEKGEIEIINKYVYITMFSNYSYIIYVHVYSITSTTNKGPSL